MSTRRRAKPRNYPPPPLRPCHVCGAVTRRRIPAPVPLCSNTCAAQLIESVYPVQSLQGFSVLLTCARAYACQLETPTEATEATLVRAKPLARAATSPARTSLPLDELRKCRNQGENGLDNRGSSVVYPAIRRPCCSEAGNPYPLPYRKGTS